MPVVAAVQGLARLGLEVLEAAERELCLQQLQAVRLILVAVAVALSQLPVLVVVVL